MRRSKLRALMMSLAATAAVAPAVQAAPPAMTRNAHVDWAKNAVIYEVNLRQGTPERNLKGMTKELPRLKDLGVDILWLMPIHPISELNRKGTLGSYYAVADYKKVNPEFGTFDDLKAFVDSAHSLGMKVIIDEVCNHSGCDNNWVKENPDFYARNDKGEMFGPFDWTDTYKFDYSNPEMRAAMVDALKFWVREADIDGYRADVAMEVPTDFWDRLRQELLTIKPVFMLAEASKPELTVAAFDADYNWPMKDLFNAIAATQGENAYAKEHKQELKNASAADIDALLLKQANEYPLDTYRMNMVTNHDLNSWEGTEFDRYGKSLGAFAVLSYTLPGMPMMYTGQEVGNRKAFEFFEHDTVPSYTANEHTAFYKMLNSLKHSQKALDAGITGGQMVRYGTTDPNIYAFSRTLPDSEVVVIANLSAKKAKLEFTGGNFEAAAPEGGSGKYVAQGVPEFKGYTDWFAGTDAKLPKDLQPWQYIVLVRK